MHFDTKKTLVTQNRILFGIIFILLIINALTIKSIISLSSDKIISLNIPYLNAPGKYVIGVNNSSKSVYTTWGKMWVNEIANFSYQNIRKKVNFILPFISPNTVFENKKKLKEFVEFVEKNFITQTFKLKDLKFKRLSGGKVRLTFIGDVRRKIGDQEDPLSGNQYAYEIIAYTEGGQVYIESIKMMIKIDDSIRNKRNKYIHINKK